MKNNWMYCMLLLVPLVYGFMANSMLLPLYPLLAQLVMALFWCFAGYLFAGWDADAWKGFLLGNSVWLVSFILFIWQFVLLDGAVRNIELAGLSQHYMLPFVYGASRLLPFLHNGTAIMTGAYILMLLVFSAGFIAGRRRLGRQLKTTRT